jgi:hypothetical protein
VLRVKAQQIAAVGLWKRGKDLPDTQTYLKRLSRLERLRR